MNNLEIIRKACIKANPEIMELGEGCIVKYRGFHPMVIGRYEARSIADDGIVEINGEEYEVENILGRPIRLADVLLALKDKNKLGERIAVNQDGEFILTTTKENWFFYGEKWDLKNDNLESQSEETIKFLANLLVMEGK